MCKIFKTFISLLIGLISSFAIALTSEDIQFIEKNELTNTKIMFHADEWGVKPSKLDLDIPPYKGQTKSLIDWQDKDPNDWLALDYWKLTREARDKYEDWKIRLRDSSHREIIGKVIQCLGRCESRRETGQTPVQTGSVIKEGDEFITTEDSYAWIMLIDGSVIRLSAVSSISIFEVNILEKKIFFNFRLNFGHIYFQQRRLGKFETIDLAETDQALLPLLLKEANREHFMRQDFQLLDDDDQLSYVLEKNPGHVTQYKFLNDNLEKNKEDISKWETEVFFFTPNGTFLLKNPIFHAFYEELSQTQFFLTDKISGFKQDDERKSSGQVTFRGYTNENANKIPLDQWVAVNPQGTGLVRSNSMVDDIKPVDFFVKRIPSIHCAREIYFEKIGSFIWTEFDKRDLAVKWGYRLWDEEKELKLRKKFLISFVRRSETTNLKSIKKLFADREIHGFDQRYYIRSVRDTLSNLKNLRDNDREVVKELNEAEYYLWTLKNGSKFIPTYSR